MKKDRLALAYSMFGEIHTICGVPAERSSVGSSTHFVEELQLTDESSASFTSHIVSSYAALSGEDRFADDGVVGWMKNVEMFTVEVFTGESNSYENELSTATSLVPSIPSSVTGISAGGEDEPDPPPQRLMMRANDRTNIMINIFFIIDFLLFPGRRMFLFKIDIAIPSIG